MSNPAHISVVLAELFASLPSPSEAADTDPCESCGRPVEAVETVPASGHYAIPQFCSECLEAADAEQWRREEKRLEGEEGLRTQER